MKPFTGNHKFLAQGRLKTGAMNQTEANYASHLSRLMYAGEVLWFKFEGIKLRLADNTFYTPDFAVLAKDCVLECHEVKGYWLDDARAKIKVAADLYPFRFYAMKAKAKKHGGGWEVEDLSGPSSAPPTEQPTEPQRRMVDEAGVPF